MVQTLYLVHPDEMSGMDQLRFQYASVIQNAAVNFHYKQYLFKKMSINPDLVDKVCGGNFLILFNGHFALKCEPVKN